MAVYVFLHNDYADWEIGYVLPELREKMPDPKIQKKTREVKSFSLFGEGVVSMGGIKVVPDLAMNLVNVADVDALILPGGLFWRDFKHSKFDELVYNISKVGKPIAGICAATGYLGSIGLLDEVKHTSNSLEFLKSRAPNYRGEKFYDKSIAVEDKNIITASGLGAVDFTDKILRRLEVYKPEVCDIWYGAFKNGIDPYA